MRDHILSRQARVWAYGVVIAALLVIGGYEILDEGQIGMWSTLAAAILGIGGSGLAVANVPPKDYEGQHRKED